MSVTAISATGKALWWILCTAICGKFTSKSRVGTGTPAQGTTSARNVVLACNCSLSGEPATRISQSVGTFGPAVSWISGERRACNSSVEWPDGRLRTWMASFKIFLLNAHDFVNIVTGFAGEAVHPGGGSASIDRILNSAGATIVCRESHCVIAAIVVTVVCHQASSTGQGLDRIPGVNAQTGSSRGFKLGNTLSS